MGSCRRVSFHCSCCLNSNPTPYFWWKQKISVARSRGRAMWLASQPLLVDPATDPVSAFLEAINPGGQQRRLRDGEIKQSHRRDYCFYQQSAVSSISIRLAANLLDRCVFLCVFHLLFARLRRRSLGGSSSAWRSRRLSLCLQCAGRASTSRRWETWSAQSVRLTASPTTRAPCTAAARKTTSAPTATPSPWPALVSVCLYLT